MSGSGVAVAKGGDEDVMEIEPYYVFLEIKEFDDLARRGEFQEGPFISGFGDGYGEPYCPTRRVWGTLKDGRRVESRK